MEEEYVALISNSTWDLVLCPHGTNVVTGKWIFKHKFKADGTFERYKAHWVLRGFTQRPNVDYEETFSPILNHVMVHTVMSLTLLRDWTVHHPDIKNAFLHGTLIEIVYCKQPTGFFNPT
jgi:hypothetical protein